MVASSMVVNVLVVICYRIRFDRLNERVGGARTLSLSKGALSDFHFDFGRIRFDRLNERMGGTRTLSLSKGALG